MRSHKLVVIVGILVFSTLLGSFYNSAAFQANVQQSSGGSTICPLSTFVAGNMLFVKNCYYEMGINEVNGEISYAAITDGSNTSVTYQEGFFAEEFDIGNNLGGSFDFTSATVTPNVVTPNYAQVSVSGEIVGSITHEVMLSGTRNLTFFADEPYFVASVSSSIEKSGPYNSHDIASWLNPSWSQAWVGPGNNGTTEVCTSAGCSHYIAPESIFDTLPGDIKSLTQTNGPTWGWLGTSPSQTSGEGVGFLLLGLNSTNPDETAITHYEMNQNRFEIEGSGAAPADSTSEGEAPHALTNTSSLPQTMYASFLVYLNNQPWKTFYDFIYGANPTQAPLWKSDVIGSYLGSSERYAAFAEEGQTPNNYDQRWFITNLATSVSAPVISATNENLQDAMIYFTGRNSSLANDFPMKMYLNIDGSDSADWNFGNGTANVLSNDGTNAGLQIVWTNSKNGLKLTMTFSTSSYSEKIDVNGSLQVTGSNGLKVNAVSLQEDLFANYLDGAGPSGLPSQFLSVTNSTSVKNLSWNYTNVGISILLPSNKGFVSVTSSQTNGYLNLVNEASAQTYPKGTSFPFSFAVSFYDPVSEFSAAYTQNIYVPTQKIFTQPFGNASRIGFTEDNFQVFPYLLSVTQFDSNLTIARVQFIKPFSGDLELFYPGTVGALKISLSNGTNEGASSFYNSQTKMFNFYLSSITTISLFGPSTSATTVTCSPGSVKVGSSTCTATVTGNNPTGTVAWQSSETGTFSSTSCILSSASCSVTYTPTISLLPTMIMASYSGDANNAPSSGAFTLNVLALRVPGVTVSCSPSPMNISSSAICTAIVTGNSPTGTVNFSSTDPDARFNPSTSCTLSSGYCQVTYVASKTGSATITASYSGDANNQQSSSTFHLTVQTSTNSKPTSSSQGDQNFEISLALIFGAVAVAGTIVGASLFVRKRS
jgi:hypothetical protein